MSASDASQIAALKGLVAGSVNLAITQVLGYSLPSVSISLSAGLVGFCGYGLSLVVFVLALRYLGTARTGAYFSAAPFVGGGDLPVHAGRDTRTVVLASRSADGRRHLAAFDGKT